MTITYSIDEKDFLDFQLYTASHSPSIRQRRFRARTYPPIMYLVFAGIMFYYHKPDLTIIFAVLAVAWYFFYPLREKRLYSNSYEKFIRENFKDKFGKPATLTINDHYIINKDEISENKMQLSEIAEINEIPGLILIKLKKGQSYILPKDKISDTEAVKAMLKAVASEIGVRYNDLGDWKWR